MTKNLKNEEPIVILGHKIDKENLPKLYAWAKSNLATLADQVQSIANAWHEGNIGMAMVCLESDLK